MKGCRPLTDEEQSLVLRQLCVRDQLLFVMGLRTGFRISELLSINLEDVWSETSGIKPTIKLHKRNTKGKIESSIMPMHPQVIPYLTLYIYDLPYSSGPLFMSRRGSRLERSTYHRNLERALALAGIEGHVATHSLRKTFAKKFYEASDKDLLMTQKALRHKSLTNTVSYLAVDDEVVGDLIKKLK